MWNRDIFKKRKGEGDNEWKRDEEALNNEHERLRVPVVATV